MDIKSLNLYIQIKNKYTPDIATLELSQFQLVFACDDLMLAGKNYPLIDDCSAKVCRAFTLRGYKFYIHRTDGVPVAMAAKQGNNRWDFSCLKIKGEVHSVLSSSMPKLDTHYQNGVQFIRVRTKLLYRSSQHGVILNHDTQGRPLPKALLGHKHFLLPERVDIIEAWMYIGVPGYWNNLLDGGFAFEPVRIIEPKEDRSWLPKNYHYRSRL